jgi:hypothetical protein
MFILRAQDERGIILWVTPLSPRIQPSHQGARVMKTAKKNLAVGAIPLLLVGVAVVAAGFLPANGQAPESEVWRFSWDAPTEGAPVDHYIVEVQKDGSILEHRFVTQDDRREYAFDAYYGHDYEVMVTAVDAQGRLGEPSPYSIRQTCNRPPPTR